ncbi:ABC transporter ATP-binding protein [Caballeronia sordidicola]|jgi:ABC-2 type transport system ATP-binding protein|uniref:ABC-type multidrug transport system, ATPase component n=1 Tax=Caballeronia sordidicola TaxID=196367 RepID=A0A226WQZ5_CABSO|nr:ABC transporter ATP-binding protein [Caballeronia sordidicola]OXC73605.1 ABC-type multidrug transport system, ATPase component [Caballeronia sordidicola]
MLRFENLCKRYDERVIFQGLRYSAGTGCVALNDETGSGKSTLLGILAGEIKPDQGDVWINGHALRSTPLESKSILAYIPDDCIPYSLQTGREYLELVASNRKTVVGSMTLDLANRFGLTPHLEKRFEQMSFGTRKKIFLTAAALGNVKVVIADEPGAGLDAPARAVLIDLFKTLSKDRAVFFSSYDADFTQACSAKMISFAELGMGV